MTRDGDWSRGAPQAGAAYAGHETPHAVPPAGAASEGSRIEALLHSVIDRLEENETRYNTALGSLEQRLSELSSRAAGSATGASNTNSEAFSRLGTQAAELAEQVRSANHSQRSQHGDDRFRAMEDRISEFAAQMQQRAAAPSSAQPAAQPAYDPFADEQMAQAQPQTDYAAGQDHGAYHAGEPQGYGAPRPQEPAPLQQAPDQHAPAYHAPHDGFSQKFANVAAGFEQSLAAGHATAELESINARIDDLVERFDAMASGRSADKSMLETVEIQLNNLAAQFDHAREHYARVDSIEVNLVHLMEMTRQSDSRLEEVAMRAAQEAARNAGGLHGEIAERLDAVQRELRVLASLKTPDPSPAPAQPHYSAPPASPQLSQPAQQAREERLEPVPPPMPETPVRPRSSSPSSLREELERSRVGATIPDFQPAPQFTGLGDQPAQSIQHFDDDADFLASARRAAAAAASSSPPKPKKKSLLSSLRRPGRTRSATPGEAAKPRSLFVAATVFLMIASAALIYGRLNENAGGSVVEAPGKSRPANDNRPEKPNSSSMLSATPYLADRKDESKLPTGIADRDAHGRAPLATEQLPPQPNERVARADAPQDEPQRDPTVFPPEVYIDPGIPGIAVRMTDKPSASSNQPRARVQQASLQQQSAQSPAATSGTSSAPMPPAAIGPQSLRVAAQQGDAAAQYEVATRYAKGSGVKQDYTEAAEWFSRAASQSFAPAQYRLAALYERGRGVQKDAGMAKLWYERAAKAGNIRAMHNLAVIYSGSASHRPDHAQAAKWFGEAARHGLADSQFNLGILHEAGLGVKQDLLEAYQWFALAAAQGDPEAGKRKAAVAAKLRDDQVRIADQAMRQWQPKPAIKEVNEVGAPEGGWRAASGPDDTSGNQMVFQVQSLLNSLGYQAGVPDGIQGPQTVSAVRRFQERNGLPTDGKITSDLVSRLEALKS